MFGSTLYIDLSEENIKKEVIDSRVIRMFLGGRGLGLYLIYEKGLFNKSIDPYDENNPLIIASGPLCGTRLPLATRATAVFKSPLTDRWVYSTVGGSLAAVMRYTLVDILILMGKAAKPIYLMIEEGDTDFYDATSLWSLDAVETEHVLKKRYGKDSAVLTIGPAGENLVPYALINHEEWRQFGREGGGAVMGSKRIKAIVFKPSEKDVDIADKEGYNNVLKEVIKKAVGPATKSYRYSGTLGLIDIANEIGFFPSYYWTEVVMDGWQNISWDNVLRKNYFLRPGACLYCPVACHRVMRTKDNGEYDLEYESTMALGGLTGVVDPSEIIAFGELADRLGLDSISLGNSIAFAVYLSEKGVIKEKIGWGDAEKIRELIVKTSRKEGLGRLIALGVKKMAEELNVKDLAIHVKGLEPAGYDPRTLKGMILNYAVAERGADHLWSSAYALDISGKAGGRFNTNIEKVKAVMDLEERNTIYDSALVCKFGRSVYDWSILVDVLNVVTGFNYTIEELKKVARRIIVLHRYINKTSMEDDRLPLRWLKEPVKYNVGKYIVKEEEWRSMISKYYKLRGYDEKGKPTSETLSDLEIF